VERVQEKIQVINAYLNIKILMKNMKNIIKELDEYFKDPHNHSTEITRDEWYFIKKKVV